MVIFIRLPHLNSNQVGRSPSSGSKSNAGPTTITTTTIIVHPKWRGTSNRKYSIGMGEIIAIKRHRYNEPDEEENQ